MKRVLFLAAGFAALLMTACGGEKAEDKKEEKKEVSEETITAFDDLKTEWSEIDAKITTIGAALQGHDKIKMQYYLDSMKTLVGKSKTDIMAQGQSFLDSLTELNEKSERFKSIFEEEKTAWGKMTEEFTKVLTDIEKGEADGEKTAKRAAGFAAQFSDKRKTLDDLLAEWEAIKRHQAALEALFSESK